MELIDRLNDCIHLVFVQTGNTFFVCGGGILRDEPKERLRRRLLDTKRS